MSSYVTRKTPGDTSWFVNDRFGMFIHYGVYSLAARREWLKNLENMSDEKYDSYLKYFNPDLFDAKEWARKAKEAGMKYAVLTTKHHDGFCMFDSKYTDYTIMNTPFNRDLVKEYVEAFRAEGLKVGLYYSLIDWHHPDFTIDWLHPRQHDEGAEKLNEGRDMKKYAQYMKDQITELLTNYGKIDILWFDFSYTEHGYGHVKPDEPVAEFTRDFPKGPKEWDAENLIKMIRELQPGILLNNRAGIEQDFTTPEQMIPDKWCTHKETGELIVWESCQTLAGSWGYNRDENWTWKSPETLLQLLINCVSLGGNLIMNIGPTSRGCFDDRADDALDVYAKWMKYHSRSIYGCTMAEPEFTAPNGCRLTQSADGKRLYLHLFEYSGKDVLVPNLAGKVEYAQLLHDGSEIQYTTSENGYVKFRLPQYRPNVVIPVIEFFLKD